MPLAEVLAAELQWMLRKSWALCFSASDTRVASSTLAEPVVSIR